MMSKQSHPFWVIAQKDIRDALHDRFIIVVTYFLMLASLTALTVAAIALHTDVTTYTQAVQTLLALGKSANMLAAPEFYPLRLLRGFVEHTEIVGAVLGILLGYRAAASERGHQTLTLMLTRPISQTQFLWGKIQGAILLLGGGLSAVFLVVGIAIYGMGGVGLSAMDGVRLLLVLLAALVHTLLFFLVGLAAALWAKHLPHALLLAFTVWLVLVLLAPQIGDTLDPDNQVAGGVFKQLGIEKPQQIEILKSFATYEMIRTGIEALSPTKHFERFSFAVLGINPIYAGRPLGLILAATRGDMLWLLGLLATLSGLLFGCRLNITKLARE
jgi:ABC-2 type transport system permease protein